MFLSQFKADIKNQPDIINKHKILQKILIAVNKFNK